MHFGDVCDVPDRRPTVPESTTVRMGGYIGERSCASFARRVHAFVLDY
jgi:hypothetical protein